MSNSQFEGDLVVLVSDKNMQFAFKGILNRVESLKIRKVNHDIYVHPERDPGCLLRGHDFLRPFVNKYSHALISLDLEGCGQENQSRKKLEDRIEKNLYQNHSPKLTACLIRRCMLPERRM